MFHWLQIVYLIGIVVLGLPLLIRPMILLRLAYRWPRLVFPLLVDPQRVPITAREALRLIDQDPREYARRFWLQLLLVRVAGGVALFIASVLALGILAEIRPANAILH
jgi:hypothetical protein